MALRFLRPLMGVALLLGVLACPPARAQESATDLALPGVTGDASAFEAALHKAHPAGLSAAARAKAANAATQALQRKDYARALSAFETLLGGADHDTADNPQFWRGLAEAELRARPSHPDRAVLAAWLAFSRVDTDSDDAVPAQLAALELLRQGLLALDLNVPELAVLQAIAKRQPDDAALQAELRQLQHQVGLVYRNVTTDAEVFPARACLGFLGTLSDAADFVPGDWVSLKPAVKDAAVTLESNHLCITGLPAGAATEVTLRHGMPGADGTELKQDATLAITMPDRRPRLVFDGARYLQPRGALATVALDSVNLSAVKLEVVKIDERNLVRTLQAYSPGDQNLDTAADDLRTNRGHVVWSGAADVAGFKHNRLTHTVLPLPEATSAPGLYALIATPGDGTPFAEDEAPSAVQLILRTDIAPTVWHGADGDTVQLRSYATGLPVAGARVDLLASNNEILASATSDADGVVHFAQALLAGENGLAPAALHVFGTDGGGGGDFTRLDLTAPDFDLSDRGASGQAQPGPIDPFLWTDRGIYRPGETVQAMALLRDEAGAPADLPLHLIVLRPDGRVFLDAVPPRAAGSSLHQAIPLSAGAPLGTWTIALKADPKGPTLASLDFEVDAFVPPRIAAEFAAPLPAVLEPGRRTDLPLDVRFLYGAPGNDLSGSVSVAVEPDAAPFPDFAAYRFGLNDDPFTGTALATDLSATDAKGRTSVAVDLARLPDTSRPLKATITAEVDDPAGRSVAAVTSLPIRPAAPLIGIAPQFQGNAVDAGSPAAFRLIALAPDGKRVAMPVTLRLVRQTPDWRLAVSHGRARYETIWHDEPVDAQQVTLAADGEPFVYSRPLPFGRYRLQVLQATGGMAASSVVFSSGWSEGGNPDIPERVAVRADRQDYQPGETATIHVEAPYAGPATVLVMTDRVKKLIDLTPASASFDVSIPVTADWGPGAYIGVHVFRPGSGKTAPARAIGLSWVALDRAPRVLPLAVETRPVYRPRTTESFAVKTAPGAWVSLAAVDEGILALTDFVTPDPLGHYFGKRRLGVGIHDDWARLLTPAGDADTMLRQGGGGDNDVVSAPIPQKIVSLFAGPVQADADGVARFPLDLPDFAGTLRLMAVGWDGTLSASLGQDIVMRDPAIVEPLLPRFLAPGDAAQAALMVDNLELPAGRFSLHLAASGSLTLGAGTPTTLDLAAGQRLLVPLPLTAKEVGPGTVTITADGPDGFHVVHAATLTVHSARAPIARASSLTLAPGETRNVAPDASAFLPGTWKASASFGLGVRYDPAALVRALAAYPLNCLEQLVSRGLPLAMLGEDTAGPDRAARLQQTISALADRQRFDGAFGLWSSEGNAEPWLSAYAADFLLRARHAGASVPQPVMDQALGWLTKEVATPPSGPEDEAAQAYALYVLALADQAPAGAIRVAAAGIDSEPTPLARAQIAAALARLGQTDRAHAILAASFAEPARRDWNADYGSPLRDQLAIAVLAAESGMTAPDLDKIRATLPGADLNPDTLNTQEQAWAAAAAASLSAGVGPVTLPVTLEEDGHSLGPAPSVSLPLTGAVSLHNPGTTALPGSLSIQGIPLQAPAAAQSGMEIKRSFFDLKGGKLDPARLTQNTSFVMLLEGRATDGQDHNAAVLAGLPAGWEIAGRLGSGKPAGMDWLGTLTDTASETAADDRYAAVAALSADTPQFRLAVLVRAVTPGSFEAPGAAVSDMYRPALFARMGSSRVTVLPSEANRAAR